MNSKRSNNKEGNRIGGIDGEKKRESKDEGT